MCERLVICHLNRMGHFIFIFLIPTHMGSVQRSRILSYLIIKITINPLFLICVGVIETYLLIVLVSDTAVEIRTGSNCMYITKHII